MNPLQQIPSNVRTTLYWVGYVLGILGQGITIVWGAIAAASPDVSMPFQLVIASAVIGLLTTQLNLLAGSNVTPTSASRQVGYDDGSWSREESGHTDTRVSLGVVIGLALAVLALALYVSALTQTIGA